MKVTVELDGADLAIFEDLRAFMAGLPEEEVIRQAVRIAFGEYLRIGNRVPNRARRVNWTPSVTVAYRHPHRPGEE